MNSHYDFSISNPAITLSMVSAEMEMDSLSANGCLVQSCWVAATKNGKSRPFPLIVIVDNVYPMSPALPMK